MFFKRFKWFLIPLFFLLPTITSTSLGISYFNNQIYYKSIIKKSEKNNISDELINIKESRITEKINILEFIPTANEIFVMEFYNNNSTFTSLKNQLISKPEILYPDWYTEKTNVINDISINTYNDNQIETYGDTKVTIREEKNINGRLYIDVNRSYKNIVGENVTIIDTFILCGFKRTQPAIFVNASTSSNGWMIYNSIVNNLQLRLENNTESNRVTFLLSNIYYYKNYNDPLESNFTNIETNFLIQNGYNISVLKPYTDNNTAMFLPEIMANGLSNTEVVRELGVVKFYRQSESFITNPINLAIILGVSLVGLLIFILLIVKYFTRGTKMR